MQSPARLETEAMSGPAGISHRDMEAPTENLCAFVSLWLI
jgi:hypothetical protein